MDIRTLGAVLPRALRAGDTGQPQAGPPAPSSSATVRRAFPPPVPVTMQMLPSYRAARSAGEGAQQGYSAARDALKD